MARLSSMDEMTSDRWERVKNLFSAVVELPSSERSSYLRKISCGDKALFGEVERLLREHEQMGGFLESGNDSDWLTVPFDAHTFAAGDLVSNRFRIVRFIGRGGMGEVYQAE